MWHAKQLNAKARVVCGECNSGWMSGIDNNEAKPVLSHLITDVGARPLPIRLLISMALFAFKTGVVADHIKVEGTPFFTRDERYAFAQRLLIPNRVFMWFAALDSDRKGIFKTMYTETRRNSDADFEIYAFTYAAGHFVLQVCAVKWKRYNPLKHSKFPLIEQFPDDNDTITPFWPIVGNCAWPPAKYLTPTALDALASRWATLNVSWPQLG
jgi:hypothetical protein